MAHSTVREFLPFTDEEALGVAEAATLIGRADVVSLLIDELGLDVNTVILDNDSLLECAVSGGDGATVEALIQRGASVGGALVQAARSRTSKLEIVKLLVAAGADVNAPKGRHVPLGVARHPEVREFLQKHGAIEPPKRKLRRRVARPEPVSTGATNLRDAITRGLHLAWKYLLETYPTEKFYYFGIYTTGDAMYADSMAGGESKAKPGLRWHPPDSFYLEVAWHFFGDAKKFLAERPYDDFDQEVAYRLNLFREALVQVDSDGLFGQHRRELLLAVWWGDQSAESRVEHARQLNPPEMLNRFVQTIDD